MSEQKPLLSVDEALRRLQQQAMEHGAVTGIEQVPLLQAVDRILAEDQLASIDVPPADNSAMDGFAFRLDDFSEGQPLPISQRIPAGVAPEPLLPGTAARIFTGSEIPAGADTVVMQESCSYNEQEVTIHKLPSNGRGDNIRPQGQDIACGEVLLKCGQILRAPELGLLASIGIATVPVYRRLTVALMSSGDELVDPGRPLVKGQIYNSNRYLLAPLLEKLNVDVIDLGCAKDDPVQIEAMLREAADRADCVFSTGGVSVGEEDHIKSALSKLGELDFWKIAVKPGKPLAFGKLLHGTPFFGLPGNPVSAFITFLIFAKPYLRALQGGDFSLPLCYQVPAGFTVDKPRKRQEYLRGRLINENGVQRVEPFGNQSSGVLTSVSHADVLVIVPTDQVIARGDLVGVLDIGQLISS